MVPFEKSKTPSLVSSIMKNIVAHFTLFRIPVKLISCIAFKSAFRYCCLLISIVINL